MRKFFLRNHLKYTLLYLNLPSLNNFKEAETPRKIKGFGLFFILVTTKFQRQEASVTTASTESTSSTVKPAKTEETASKEKKKVKVPVGSLVLMILIGFGAIGAYVYKKIGKQNKKDDRTDPDADYREEKKRIIWMRRRMAMKENPHRTRINRNSYILKRSVLITGCECP